MSALDLEIAQYVEMESFEKDNVSYIINVTSEIVDERNVIDPGILTAIVDTFSSFSVAAFFDKPEDKWAISVSMNLKITSLGEMHLGNIYRMKINLKYHKNKRTFFEINIFDKDNKLVKIATHLKNKTEAKF